jgi:hypothetical protein
MKQKTLKVKKITIANLGENIMTKVVAGGPILSSNPKKCETLVPLCVETAVDCNQSGTPCLP